MRSKLIHVASFVRDCVDFWGPEYPEQLLKRMSSVLRWKSTLYEDAATIYYVLTAMAYCDLQPFAKISMPEGTGLVPTLLVGWQRQRCEDPDEITRKFYNSLPILV